MSLVRVVPNGMRLRGDYLGAAVAVDMNEKEIAKDPAQQFAERVANELWRIGPFKEISDLIANELRAGSWAPRRTEVEWGSQGKDEMENIGNGYMGM